jgi:DNA adenine methylase
MEPETLRFLPWGQFFPYLGGKTFLIKKLLSLVPPHEIYVEVFGGSAELLFRKEPSKIEVYNDIDGELVNLFEVVRNRFDEFLEKARWLLYSRELLNRLEKPAEDPVEQAVRTFYVYNCSMLGQKGTGWRFTRKIGRPKTFRNKLEKHLHKIHERLRNVYIDQLDFRRCIRNWDTAETFFFMDPPYRGTAQANQIAFTDQDFEDLADICKTIQGKFLITLNDDPFIRETFSMFQIEPFDSYFSARPVTRMMPLRREGRGRYTHVLIRNYDELDQRA